MAAKKNKPSDEEQVQTYLAGLDHPLRAELEALRRLILNCNDSIRERIKWNAPSYYTTADLFTFNLHDKKVIRLIFHHPAIVQVASPLLQGNYPDRRIAYFEDMEQVIDRGLLYENSILVEYNDAS